MTATPSSHAEANRELFDQINAEARWLHAKKVRPIQPRRMEQRSVVQTLEGEETVPAGTYLCRGEVGDIWPHLAELLHANYFATGEVSADGWQTFHPHPDNTGVLAARIDHLFAVTATWGELNGKAGDDLVKNYDDRDTPYPRDVWIVDARLFWATYARVE